MNSAARKMIERRAMRRYLVEAVIGLLGWWAMAHALVALLFWEG